MMPQAQDIPATSTENQQQEEPYCPVSPNIAIANGHGDSSLISVETSSSEDDGDDTGIANGGVFTTAEDSAKKKDPRLFKRRGSNLRTYSVSFMDHGFSYREVNPSYMTSIGGGPPVLSNENPTGKNMKPCCKKKLIHKSPEGGCRAERSYANLSKSLSSKRSNYQTIPGQNKSGSNLSNSRSLGALNPDGTISGPIIFCIHGNKYGVARCCDDLEDETDLEQGRRKRGAGSSILETHSETAPLINSSGSSHGGGTFIDPEDIHCHTDQGTSGVDKVARRKLIIASILCVLFMIAEVIGGYMANSLAIATDAAHLLTDFASFMISLFSIWMAGRPATKRMSFGWHRAEVIGATASVLLIWVVTGILLYLAVERIITKNFEINAEIMLITSGIGVIVNIIMGCSLHGEHGHTHGGGGGGGHGHSHGGGNGDNINVRAALIHVIGDFLQSLGVFVAALVIYFKPDWHIIDPICTFLFSVLVLFTTIRILKDTMNVLMEGMPKDVDFSVVEETFKSVDGIVSVHNLRIWGLTTEKTALSAHLAIRPGSNAQGILKEASLKIRAKYRFYEMTLQVEEFQEEMEDCNQCQAPEN